MQEPQKKPVTYEPLSLLEGLTAAYQQGSTIKFTANELGLLEALDSPNPEVSTAASFKTHELGEKLTEILVKDECFPGHSVRIIRN